MGLHRNPLPGVPDVESPLFETLFETKNVSAETLDIARRLRRDGFAVIDFPEPQFERLADRIIRDLDSKYDWESWRKGTTSSLRIQDAWQSVPEVKQIACNPSVLTLLSHLYGRRAFPFQTLNFPVGTQQHFHSDSIHFSSHPERFMAGVWLALEEIDASNGPLLYYAGSHRLPVFTNEHVGVNPDLSDANPYQHYTAYERAWESIVESLNLKPLEFHAKKGQALLWAANLLHGGAAQTDLNRTRYSQVTHYFFEECCYYTPLLSVPFLGRIALRDMVDIATGYHVQNKVNGVEISKSQVPSAAEVVSATTRFTKKIGQKFWKPADSAPKKLPPEFDPAAYLRANPDVAAAKVDPAKHWLEFGHREGRPLR